MPVDTNNYCIDCPFININTKKCPIYEKELKKDENGLIRLNICIKENKTKFGG